MLLFVVAEPKKGSETHGVVQRVHAIDGWFLDVTRSMLFISLRRNLRRRRSCPSKNLTVEHLNVFLHAPRLLAYGFKARAIYVHTCLAAIRAFIFYAFPRKLILDVHGLLPEEFLMMRKKKPNSPFYFLCQWIERLSLRRSAGIVVVTDAMRTHFRNKYPGLKASVFTIPIFAEESRSKTPIVRDPNLVIYSGGLQEWQCIDETLKIVESTQDQMSFLFLTGEAQKLQAITSVRNIRHFEIKSVNRQELPELYARASYGFVLRKKSIVNLVACPTKLVEYMESGVIPIVHERYLGDFCAVGYRYILDSDFTNGIMPDVDSLETMRRANRLAIHELRRKAKDGFEDLICTFNIRDYKLHRFDNGDFIDE